MRHLHIRTRRRSQALAVLAQTEPELLFAGRQAEVRRRAAYVADVALEARILKKALGFLYHTLLAADGDGSPLVKRERTEVARAEAAAVVGYRELNLPDARYSSLFLVALGVPPHIRQRIYPIELPGIKRRHRRILQQEIISVPLDKSLSANRVGFL